MRKDAAGIAVAILFTVTAGAAAQAPAPQAPGAQIATVRVAGRGSVRAEPGMATIRIGFMTEDANAQRAASANTAAVNKVMSALKAAGVEKKDLMTSDFSVYPQFRIDRERKNRITSYRVSNTVIAMVRNTSKVGGILSKAVAAGPNQIKGTSFSVSNPEKYLNEARKKAVENAMEKARVYASAAGMKLGEVLEISEPGVPRLAYGRGPVRAFGAGSVPIEIGEVRLEAHVHLVIALKP